MQRRGISAIEAITSTAVGFAVSWLITITVLPAFGYNVTPSSALGINAIYTAASVIRGYAIRRAFSG